MIICGFPGIGKSYLSNRDHVVDLDSSNCSKTKEFPINYVDKIEQLDKEGHTVFCSTHNLVLDELEKRKINSLLVYPSKEDKDIYLNRYQIRGNTKEFIDLVDSNWELWLTALLERETNSFKHVILDRNQYLSDYI